jgi:PST family polysaccharide transporter
MSGTLFLRAATVVPDALLQRRFSFVRRVVIEPINMVTYGLTAALALLQGMGVWGLVLALYAAASVETAASWSFCRWKPDFT